MTSPVQQIVVVGRDWEPWIAALALHRTLARRGVQVTVLELPTLLLPTDVIAAVPAVDALHRALGVETLKVAEACAGVPMVGQRFSNWSRTGAPFIHPYEAEEAARNDPPLLHYWVKARREGMQVAFENFSLVAAAAKEGRIATPSAIGGECPLPGYQFDARRYAGLWKKLAIESGISHRQGRIAVERDDRAIVAIQGESGERFTADLFIDASGAEAILIRDMPGAEVESYARWLPTNAIISASAPPLSPLPPFAQVSAFRAGWVGLHPLQDRTAVTGALSTAYATEEMIGGLAAIAGAPITGDVSITEFKPAGRPEPWAGNCVAIGRAALELEPLDAVQLHFLHLALTQLVAILDTSFDPFAQADSFNSAVSGYGRNLRNFQIAHYRLNQRFDEPMWDRARDASGPPELDAKIAQFEAAGEIPMQAYESFARESWAALFLGHGLVPRAYDSWVDEMDRDQHMAMMQDRLGAIAQTVRNLPSVEHYLGRAHRPQPQVEA